MNRTERITWLQQHTRLKDLSDVALGTIADAITEEPIAANRRVVLEETPPTALYILYTGQAESYHTSQLTPAFAIGLLPGKTLHFKELLLDEVAEQTVITLSDCLFWTIPREEFLAIAQAHPEMAQTLSRQLVTELTQVAAQLTYERDRQAALRPYLVSKVRRGIIGKSRYAVRLRQEIKKAASDRGAVLIFGEPGLEKDNLAALIHFGSRSRSQPFVKINCNAMQANGAELFGRAGGKVGLLEWTGQGTLLLNNVQDLSEEVQAKLVTLLETGEYAPIAREGEAPPLPRVCDARIIMISERVLPTLEVKGLLPHSIKVPPLRVRKADIEATVEYFISLFCRSRNLPKPAVTPEAIRRLQGYDFPGNMTELDSMVERAIIQANGSPQLNAAVFWETQAKGKQFRWNLLNAYPQLRQFLKTPWFPDRLNYWFTTWFFALVVGVLMIGPQARDRNVMLMIFWAGWWPLVLIAFPFVGRAWCSICPFMIYGEIAQKIRNQISKQPLLPWPRVEAEKIGGWFLFGLFVLILLWEELWDLENTAYLSGCLLLLITAGAVIFSVLFERRFWCRYLCPIGGMNGLFAKLSMTELRAQQGTCSATCTTYQCYKGGPQKGEGLETDGCPLYSHPAQLQDNRDCVLCMTCLKACPHRSVEINLRPPGIELWTTHIPSYPEICLLFLLLGAVFLHHIPALQQWIGWEVSLENFLIHTGLATLALFAPGAIVTVIHVIIRRMSPTSRRFLEMAYGYLPLVLGANLAHYLSLGLNEAGQFLPLTLATIGQSASHLPVWIAHPAVITFLQGTVLIVGWIASLLLTQKIGRQPIGRSLPQFITLTGLSVLLWNLLLASTLP